MPLYSDPVEMLSESLPELLLAAEYCLKYEKHDSAIWIDNGCLGFPAALLLLCIADSIGSYTQKGEGWNHFKVLNSKQYYSQNLTDDELKVIYDYRNKLAHNSAMSVYVGLKKDFKSKDILEKTTGKYYLNLIPFYNLSIKAITTLFDNTQVFQNNKTISNLFKQEMYSSLENT